MNLTQVFHRVVKLERKQDTESIEAFQLIRGQAVEIESLENAHIDLQKKIKETEVRLGSEMGVAYSTCHRNIEALQKRIERHNKRHPFIRMFYKI